MKALLLALTLLSANIIVVVPAQEEYADLYSECEQHCEILAQAEGIENTVDETYKLKDLAGNIFYAKIGEEEGFMVYDPVAQNCIEKSASLKSPYDFNEPKDYYYFGPMNYYERINDTFYSLMIQGEEITIEYAYQLQDIFSNQLSEFRNSQSQYAYEQYVEHMANTVAPLSVTNGDKVYINNYQYIRDAKHPLNYDGTCGFVAATLILNYWEKTMHKGTVLPQYLDSNGDLNSTGTYNTTINLKDRLVEFNGGVGNGASWGKSVRDSLIKYCAFAGINATSSYYLGKIGLDNELANNRPAIIFGSMPRPSNSERINHAVVAYGIDKEWWGGYYIVNYGWYHDTAEVSLSSAFIGSVTFFQLDDDTYSRDYIVLPQNYGFEDSYVTSDTSNTVKANGLTFETNRLRCGFTQNEYINLCPRREGYGTAYLEYYFTNPVTQIEVDLSFWSDDERYGGANIAEARIEYQRLCENTFISALDLLKANLPTDRKQQTTYTITFPGGTRYFRFYAHFDYMSGFKDRNKGRISIGNMWIHTYN